MLQPHQVPQQSSDPARQPLPTASLPPSLEHVVSAFAERFRLTARETEIVTLLVSGYVSVPKIASKLELSPNTVHNHFKNVFRRTGVNSKTNILTLMMHEMARTSLIAAAVEPDEAAASVD